MIREWRLLGISLSLGNLLVLARWHEIQDRGFDYFRKPPTLWCLLAQTLWSVILYGFLIFLLLSFARRAHLRLASKMCLGIYLSLLLLGLDLIRSRVLQLELRARLPSAAIILMGATICVLLVYAVFWWEQKTWTAAGSLVICLLPLFPIMLLSTCWTIIQSQATSSLKDKPLSAAIPNTQQRPRVLWLVFDEMDQHLAFRARPATVQLPELDRFRKSALYAENALTPGNDTLVSIPTLITGRRVAEAHPERFRDLLLTFADSRQRSSWSSQRTVFTEARRAGFNSALIGYYHPYCRILDGLTHCYSLPALHSMGETAEYLRSLTPLQTLWFYCEEPLSRSSLLTRFGVIRPSTTRRRKMRVAYLAIRERALSIVRQTTFNLVFVHWPVPHPPGFYNRFRHTFVEQGPSDYFDNLALVDESLGALRKEMEAAGTWDSTTILITSDHPLRLATTKNTAAVQREFDASNRFEFPYVPFLLKLAGHKHESVYSERFDTAITASLVLTILEGGITSPRDIVSWIDQRRSDVKVSREGVSP